MVENYSDLLSILILLAMPLGVILSVVNRRYHKRKKVRNANREKTYLEW